MAITRMIKSVTLCAGSALALIALSDCGGDGDSRQERGVAARSAGATAAPMPMRTPIVEDRHDLEVFIDQRPVKPYLVVTSFRFPAPSNAGEEIDYIRERARREGGDAVLVKVVSGSLVRTDIEDRSLIEATVICWR